MLSTHPFDSTAKFMLEKARNLQASERAYSTAQVRTFWKDVISVLTSISFYDTHIAAAAVIQSSSDLIILYTSSSCYTPPLLILLLLPLLLRPPQESMSEAFTLWYKNEQTTSSLKKIFGGRVFEDSHPVLNDPLESPLQTLSHLSNFVTATVSDE